MRLTMKTLISNRILRNNKRRVRAKVQAHKGGVMSQAICPCGTDLEFSNCCEPIFQDIKKAMTAEALMRSRYSAFVKNNMNHILVTHDPSTRDTVDHEANQSWSSKADWKGLEVLSVSGGQAEDSQGTVEFRVNFEMDGRPQTHHELSQFRKVKGAWFFVDGKNLDVSTFQREQPKVGRNDPCLCGSGKKYKKCCG